MEIFPFTNTYPLSASSNAFLAFCSTRKTVTFLSLLMFLIDENIVFDFSAFLQPALSSFSDYKATLIGQFDFNVNENFKISLQYNTFYDSKPPSTAVKKEEGFATVFSYNFN